MILEQAQDTVVVPDVQSTRFQALPAGEYSVTIFDVVEGEYGDKTANAGRPNYKVQLRISEGQTGANRRLFETIGLFRQWAPKAGNETGSDNFTFFGFFAAVEGVSEKDFRKAVEAMLSKDESAQKTALEAISSEKYRAKIAKSAGKGLQVPSPGDLMGKPLNVSLKIEADRYGYSKAVETGTLEDGETEADFTTNRVAGWKAFREVTSKGSTNTQVAFTL